MSSSLKKHLRRSYFLFEIVIATALSASILALLFRFLVSYSTIEKKIEKAEASLVQRERIQEKLGALLTSLEPRNNGPSFYTMEFPDEKRISVIVYYNAGIDPDPAFSGPNVARIYVNKTKDLCLTQWALDKEKRRTEVLLHDVRNLEWSFFGKEKKWSWLSSWPKKWGGMPSMIRLKIWCGIDKKEKIEPNLQFAFIIPIQEPIEMLK